MHWSTTFETTFKEFDMASWGSTVQSVWETGSGEDRGWEITKILVRVRHWDATKSVFQDQTLKQFSEEEWSKVDAIILAVAKKWISYGSSLQVKIAFTVEPDKAMEKAWLRVSQWFLCNLILPDHQLLHVQYHKQLQYLGVLQHCLTICKLDIQIKTRGNNVRQH